MTFNNTFTNTESVTTKIIAFGGLFLGMLLIFLDPASWYVYLIASLFGITLGSGLVYAVKIVQAQHEYNQEINHEEQLILNQVKKCCIKENFHILASYDDYELRKSFEFLYQHPSYLGGMALKGKRIIENFHESDIGWKYLQKFRTMYADPISTIAKKLVKGQKLNDFEKERLIYEINLETRKYLEENLPHNHDILQAIHQINTIQIKNGLQILK